MKAIQHFRSQLDAGHFALGATITLTDPLVTEALAGSVDFIWIDLEHSAMSPEAMQGHLLAARGRQVPALVRVAVGETGYIKPVLDAGADGIIVPQVRSVDEVRRIVADCRYPPLGRRGYGPRVPTNFGRDGGPAYVQRANAGVFVAIMVETREAVADLEAILAVPGVDSIVLGPMDLSGSYGHLGEVEHPEVVAVIEHVIAKTRAAGRYMGSGMGADPDYAVRMARRGVQWLQFGGDYGYLTAFMDQMTRRVRAGLAAQPAAP